MYNILTALFPLLSDRTAIGSFCLVAERRPQDPPSRPWYIRQRLDQMLKAS